MRRIAGAENPPPQRGRAGNRASVPLFGAALRERTLSLRAAAAGGALGRLLLACGGLRAAAGLRSCRLAANELPLRDAHMIAGSRHPLTGPARPGIVAI